jgi:cytochrome c oxidase subunit 2
MREYSSKTAGYKVMFMSVILSLLSVLIPSLNSIKNDYPEPWQVCLQDPATPVMEGIINLYHDIFFILIIITVVVTYVLIRAVILFTGNQNPESTTHGETIEIVWTVTPALILMLIGVPSFTLLYSMDEVIDPAITVKAIGHQWYWTYEYSDYASADGESIVFDSYMIPEDDLEPGGLRLLEVDNRVVLPVNTHVRLIVSGADVIHSWTIPSFGIKVDALPGRLNQLSLYVKREGVFYGQCSEICGVNHGFMPIVVEVVSMDKYLSWVAAQ